MEVKYGIVGIVGVSMALMVIGTILFEIIKYIL